jgi:hypothetical protein
MGKDHEVTGVESYAVPIQQPGRGVPFGEQMVDDYVPRAWRQIGCNRAGGWRTEAPWSGEFSVVEHGPLELHYPQHF